MKTKEVNEKVQLLKAGQIVEINGDWFRASQIPAEWDMHACEACDLDSICRGDVNLVCSEMETTASYKWLLKLAHR